MKLNLNSDRALNLVCAWGNRLSAGLILGSLACLVAVSVGCDTGTYSDRLNEAPPVVDEQPNADDSDADSADAGDADAGDDEQ